MRVQPRPRFRAGASVSFADFADAVQAARELAQSGLNPANCRLLGHDEALMSGSGDGSHAILVLGFESADHELGPWLARALEICGSHRGEVRGGEGDPAAAWRASFLRGGHLRDGLVRLGLISETFETAVTWDRFWEFHEGVLAATRQAVARHAAAAWSHAVSRTCIPTAPHRITRSSRPAVRAGNWSSGMRSSSRPRRRSWRSAARSPITTPSGATIAAGTCARCRRCSPARFAARRPNSTRPGS